MAADRSGLPRRAGTARSPDGWRRTGRGARRAADGTVSRALLRSQLTVASITLPQVGGLARAARAGPGERLGSLVRHPYRQSWAQVLSFLRIHGISSTSSRRYRRTKQVQPHCSAWRNCRVNCAILHWRHQPPGSRAGRRPRRWVAIYRAIYRAIFARTNLSSSAARSSGTLAVSSVPLPLCSTVSTSPSSCARDSRSPRS
jgi:hypothetical protein